MARATGLVFDKEALAGLLCELLGYASGHLIDRAARWVWHHDLDGFVRVAGLCHGMGHGEGQRKGCAQ